MLNFSSTNFSKLCSTEQKHKKNPTILQSTTEHSQYWHPSSMISLDKPFKDIQARTFFLPSWTLKSHHPLKYHQATTSICKMAMPSSSQRPCLTLFVLTNNCILNLQFPNYGFISIEKEIVNEEKRRPFNSYVWGQDYVFGATENKHQVIETAVCQVIQSYSIHPSFLPWRLPNCGNSLKLFVRVEGLGKNFVSKQHTYEKSIMGTTRKKQDKQRPPTHQSSSNYFTRNFPCKSATAHLSNHFQSATMTPRCYIN